MFVQRYVTVFLRLCMLGRKETPQRLLRLTAFLMGLEERGTSRRKLTLHGGLLWDIPRSSWGCLI